VPKAVLATKVDPTYDDLPENRYHFPRTYLRTIEAALGDWIIYYEPRRTSGDLSSRGGRQAYFATAKVASIHPDNRRPDHFYAYVEGYLPFERAVGFREGNHFYESRLQRPDGGTSKGAFGRSVRPITDAEYDMILQAAYAHVLTAETPQPPGWPAGMAEEPATFQRPIIERVVARPFRDAVFASAVKEAYDNTCAITGLKIINGGGRSEVQAAHIRPVADNGPDSVRNGIALCGTVHWMFDRGLVSLDDEFRILTVHHKVPDTIHRLMNPSGRIILPPHPDLRPHPQFLRYHRACVFKGTGA
jgi:putative restriction endonuclease